MPSKPFEQPFKPCHAANVYMWVKIPNATRRLYNRPLDREAALLVDESLDLHLFLSDTMCFVPKHFGCPNLSAFQFDF